MNHSSVEAERLIREKGWYYAYTKGDHKHFKHPSMSGKVTIPANRKDLNIKTWNSIMRQAGLK
ncbi:MAG: type II toxin-antitoxin system HicA family toxin [Oscillospiraceae bacterium]|nr:type II toxin-antitoxin system HicA family toxin [Oscillospiraceae bacterium]